MLWFFSRKIGATLKLADYHQAPQEPGCYILLLEGVPKYVGVGTDMTGTVRGLRRRLWQHYNSNASKPEIQKNKDDLTVELQVTMSPCEARSLEPKLPKKYITLAPGGWNEKMPPRCSGAEAP